VTRAYFAFSWSSAQELFFPQRSIWIAATLAHPGKEALVYARFDIGRQTYVHSDSLLGGRPMVGLQTLDLAIGVRVPASQPNKSQSNMGGVHHCYLVPRDSELP
jgi:hypothetical protein